MTRVSRFMDSESLPAIDSVQRTNLLSDRPSPVGAEIRAAMLSVYREHRLVLCLSLGYIAVGGAILAAFDRPWPIQLTNRWFAIAWVSLSVTWLMWEYFRNPRSLQATFATSRVLGAITVMLVTVPTQVTFQSLKQSIGPLRGFTADVPLHKIDTLLHGGMPWRFFEVILSNWVLLKWLDGLYMAWFPMLFVFLVWASWSNSRVLRQRALTAFLLMFVVAGTIVACFAASAGPCYYDKVVTGLNPYETLMARLDAVAAAHNGLMARAIQQGLWELASTGHWDAVAGISAMPSLHVGIAVLMVLVARPISRMLSLMLAGYAIAIQIGSVILGWHYAVDGYAGALLAIACWKGAGTLMRFDQRVQVARANGRHQ